MLNNEKKFALLLYGDLRTYQKSFKFLKKNLIDLNNIDIFISTHKKQVLSSHVGNIDDKANSFSNCYGNNLKVINYLEENDLSELFKILRDKLQLIDNELYQEHETEILKINNFDDWCVFYKKLHGKDGKGFYLKNKKGYQYLLHEIIMIYHRLNAFRLMETYSKDNNINYNGIIIYRPDLYFMVPLDLSKLIFNDQTIYFRLEFMIISSFNGIKKLLEKLLENYYCHFRENAHHNLNLSETQHNLILHNKEYYSNSFDILCGLIHFRATNGNALDLCLHVPSQKKYKTLYIDEKNIKNDLPYIAENLYKRIDNCAAKINCKNANGD